VTGIPEVIQSGKTGLRVPQRDPQALAVAIEQLLEDPALRVRLATEGRRLIEAEFDIRRNTQRRRELFRAFPNGSIAKTLKVASSFPSSSLETIEAQEVG